ncbi:MAG: histidine--tRNA ligase [Phycisphaerales bacterium JB039]
MAKRSFQAPTGTRDLYPEDAARRRYLTEAWRDVSLIHGFEEIAGPTFEHLDLYTVKSGEGIVSELFSFRRAGGDTDYALRPEFTPTLARMYAARANALPKPTKWFTAGSYFRAERPQRGRLREFLQWNIDILGGAGDELPVYDAEIIACCVDLLSALGLTSQDVTIRISDRSLVTGAMRELGVEDADVERALALLDRRDRMPGAEFEGRCREVGLEAGRLADMLKMREDEANSALAALEQGAEPAPSAFLDLPLAHMVRELARIGAARWCRFDFGIVRGLAYYTGMVFEVVVEGERAVAGGGRYDGLVELLGGPSTPAVGFAMGDAVISLVLEDKGLLPQGAALLDRIARPPASVRPQAFVVTGDESLDMLVMRLVADLRRAGVHARRSCKTTRNIGKLLKEASQQQARFAVIVEDAQRATVKNLDDQSQREVALGEVAAIVR